MKHSLAERPSEAWVTTYTGRHIDLLSPETADIHIDDIAGPLSKFCRFGGHCSRIYSVAEHSLLGADHCMPANRLEFLMHDSPEAYLGDVLGPLKTSPLFAGYRELEARWWDAIALRFGLRNKLPREIHVVDQRMLVTEQRDLKGRRSLSTDLYKPFAMTISPVALTEEQLREKFLAKFYELVSVTVGAKR